MLIGFGALKSISLIQVLLTPDGFPITFGNFCQKKSLKLRKGGLAQLARAPALQAGGHRFESDILHQN